MFDNQGLHIRGKMSLLHFWLKYPEKLSRTLEVPDWECITQKVCGWLKEVNMYPSFKFQPSGRTERVSRTLYVINAGVVKDTRSSWLELHNLKSMWMAQGSKYVLKFSLLEQLKGCQEPSCPLCHHCWDCGGHRRFLAEFLTKIMLVAKGSP